MLIVQPGSDERLGDLLRRHLIEGQWEEFLGAVAFAKRSGVQHIAGALRAFSERGLVRLVVGIDLGGTSREGLVDLLACLGDRGKVWVFHNEAPATFHPKVYLFRNSRRALAIIGSGNLTQGGLFTNYEASLVRSLDLENQDDKRLMDDLDRAFAAWLDETRGTCRRLTPGFLDELCASGYVVEEAKASGEEKPEGATAKPVAGRRGPILFGRVYPPRPQAVKRPARNQVERLRKPSRGSHKLLLAHSTFVMTLQRTDVGVGQTTSGTSRRSPEIFIPLRARDFEPQFWGWPDQFNEDTRRPGKFDRTGVVMELNGEIIHVNMMTWPAKHDFRLRNEALRSAGSVGDILKIKKVEQPDRRFIQRRSRPARHIRI